VLAVGINVTHQVVLSGTLRQICVYEDLSTIFYILESYQCLLTHILIVLFSSWYI
jgi:hypothetical protein